MSNNSSCQSITKEQAFGMIKNIIDRLPCFELNVKRWNDILYLVKEWELYDSSHTTKNDPVMESQMGIRWMEDDESK